MVSYPVKSWPYFADNDMNLRSITYGLIRFYHLFRKHILHRDVQMFISPVTVRHVERYRLAGDYIPEGSRVLDAACGSGYGSGFLTSCDYVGLDLDVTSLEYAKRNYPGSFHELPIQRAAELGQFDAIISFETLEHLDKSEEGLSDLLEALKPGGLMVLSFPLNHPDTIYHRTIFTPTSVDTLLTKCIGTRQFKRESFYQPQFRIEPLNHGLEESEQVTLTLVLQEIL